MIVVGVLLLGMDLTDNIGVRNFSMVVGSYVVVFNNGEGLVFVPLI